MAGGKTSGDGACRARYLQALKRSHGMEAILEAGQSCCTANRGWVTVSSSSVMPVTSRKRAGLFCWPAAHRFRRGHRLRLQVSSGAHPRYARNTGSGEPLATATTLLRADQQVHHDPEHPSAVILPVATAV